MMNLKERQERLKDVGLSESGDYEYTGDYWKIDEEKGGGHARRNLILLLCLLILLVVLSGFSESEAATKAFYVILPYVGEVTSLFVLAWGSASVLYSRDRVRAGAVERNAGKIIGGATLLAMFAMIGLIMTIVHIARRGIAEGMMPEIAYPALRLASAVVAMQFKKTYENTAWVRIE